MIKTAFFNISFSNLACSNYLIKNCCSSNVKLSLPASFTEIGVLYFLIHMYKVGRVMSYSAHKKEAFLPLS